MEEKECLQAEREKMLVTSSSSGTRPKRRRNEGPDVGWAWVVGIAACMINFIMAGLGRISGILFIAFIEIFKVDRERASIPFSIRSAGRNLFGPVVGILGQKYGPRSTIIVGGIIGSLSSAACFFTPDIVWVTVLWGGINGLGTALTTTLPQVVIGQYFIKHRTTASGLAFSGGCVGSFLFPALIEWLLHNYGIEGTFLITGAIIMHCIPAALILRTPPWIKREEAQLTTNATITSQPKLSSSLNNLVDECDDIEICNNKKNVQTDNKDNAKVNLISEMSQKITIVNERPNIEENKILSVNNDVFPNFKLLRENINLVFKILYFKGENCQNINQYDILDEIERYYHSMCNCNETSQFQKNLWQVKNNIFLENDKDSSSIRDQKYRSLHYGKKIAEIEVPRAHSTPDVKVVVDNETCCKPDICNKLSTLEELDENTMLNCFEESNELIILVINELRKINKVYSSIERKTQEEVVSQEIPPLEEKESVKPAAVKSDSFLEMIKTAFRLYVNPLFLMVCVCRAIHFITFVPTMTVVVDFSMDKGLHEEDGKYAIGAISLGDLLGRLCLGWITDRGYLSQPKYMLIVMVLQGITTSCLPMMHTKGTIFASLALFGMLQGSLFIRHNVLVSHYMRREEQSIAMGCMNFFSGLLGFALPVYIGYFRDTMGSYDCIFYINGIIGSCVGFLWAFEPFFVRCVNAKRITQKIPT